MPSTRQLKVARMIQKEMGDIFQRDSKHLLNGALNANCLSNLSKARPAGNPPFNVGLPNKFFDWGELNAVKIYESMYPDMIIFGFSSAGAAASCANAPVPISESANTYVLIVKFFIWFIFLG